MSPSDSAEGRWMTPDQLAGDLTNPQSLNRYAYVLNNPTTLTDPLGLRAMPCQLVDTVAPAGCANGGGNDFGGYTVNGQPVANSVGQAVQAGGFGCTGGCSSSVVGSNGKTYTLVQTAGTPDIYAPNGELLYPDGESVAEVGLEHAENGVYSVFAAMCINQGCNPFAPQQVGYQFAKGVYNVTWGGHTLNTSNLAGYWKDPISFMHNGNPSWYQGSPLDMFNVVHLIGGAALEGHDDPFGALNPLHYLIQFPQMLVPAGGRYNATCSLAGGCVIGR